VFKLNQMCCERANPLSPFNFAVKSKKSITVAVQIYDDFIDEISFKIKKGNNELKTSIDSESVDFKKTANIEITEIRR
jgi:hypothetical protein